MSESAGYRPRMSTLNLRHPLLASLAADLEQGAAAPRPIYSTTASLWQAAGIFVTDDALALTEGELARHGGLGILTRHARPLSWLFFALRMDGRLTGGPGAEREFFGRLADAANAFLAAHQPEEDDWRPLLGAVLQAAGAVLRERQVRFVQSYVRPGAPRRPRAHRTASRALVAA